MKIVLIAAVSTNNVIGKGGEIPWKIQTDLDFFRKQTTGSAIIMGRATFNSIGRPLPNRLNIIMSRTPKQREDDVVEVSSKEEACKVAKDYSENIHIIGGENIYKEFLPIADIMFITEVKTFVDNGNAFFPEFNKEEWQESSRKDLGENGYLFSIVKYIRS